MGEESLFEKRQDGGGTSLADLRRAAGPLLATMQRSSMAMVVTDPRLSDNPIVFTNEAFLRLTGYSQEEVIGRNCRFLQTHRTDRKIIEEMRSALVQGEGFDTELLNARKDGSIFWNRLVIAPILGTCGEPDFFFSTQDDVSWRHEGHLADEIDAKDRKLATVGAELLNAEEQLRIVKSAFGIGVFSAPAGFATVTCSDQFCDLLGLQPACELPLPTINSVIGAGQPPIIETTPSQPSEPISDADILITRPDNREERWIARRGRWVQDGDGAAARFVGVVYDVTDLKLREVQLQEFNDELETRVEERTRNLKISEERAKAYFDLAPECSLLVRVLASGDASIDDLNLASEELYRLARQTVQGKPLRSFMIEKQAGSIEYWSKRVLETGSSFNYVVTHVFQPDTPAKTFEVVAAPIERHAGGGGVVLFSARDVTEQRQTEDQLRQAQKMEAVGQLTGGLAHDFNNLLAGVSGSLELMGSRLLQGRFNELERYISAAQSATRRAAALTHRLLAFSRRQTLEARVTDIDKLVAGMEELIRRTVGPSITIEVVGTSGLWTAVVDPPQLENALLNLCINARDAMPEGGRITIETHNKWVDIQAGRERDLPPGQYVSLAVTDTGTGMSPDVIAKAFDPFFTTKPLGEGTGLGLSMIYGFAKQSGGQVRIYSEVGKGTTVSIYLPRHYGKSDQVDALPAVASIPHAKAGETILVVDDEPTVRMLVSDVLQDLGYTAIEAADSTAGLNILQSDARIDLLITDVGLPGGLNGRQMADAGRVKRKALKVLFITGYAENAIIGNGQLEPGMQVLTKPFVVNALGERIKTLLSTAG